ncbi:MAG: metacaspase [Piptocephalis tieghemiana]|nr:MAG: metacaspase [Piptocephalis tieghemiana]
MTREQVNQEEEGNNVIYSSCPSDFGGRKKAVLIGINYIGDKVELRGCINDVHNIREFITRKYGFPPSNMLILTDDQEDPQYHPTCMNILRACKWLVHGAQPGDSLFFHYSGHGGLTKNLDNTEVSGFDTTIYPLDFRTKGQIRDNTLHQALVKPLPKGARLTAVFDSCHSGTMLDLPFLYKCDGSLEVFTDHRHRKAALAIIQAGISLVSEENKRGLFRTIKENVEILFSSRDPREDIQEQFEEDNTSVADVYQFAGCRDDQTSADANIDNAATGAMSHALVACLEDNAEPTYAELLQSLRDYLKGNYTQIPQLSTGHPVDINRSFKM